MLELEPMERDCIILHAAFGVASVLALTLPGSLPVGWRLTALVVLYNVTLPVAAARLNYTEWLNLWTFLLPVSILQVFPDWFLAAQLGVLTFPDTGSARIGEVPAFMGGMWVIPLFLTVFLGRRVEERTTRRRALLVVCLASGLLFVGSEAVLWAVPIWIAQNVLQVAHVAVYLIIPEIILGLSAFLAFESAYTRPLWYRLAAGFTVMVIYLGNLSFCYFVVERLLLG